MAKDRTVAAASTNAVQAADQMVDTLVAHVRAGRLTTKDAAGATAAAYLEVRERVLLNGHPETFTHNRNVFLMELHTLAQILAEIPLPDGAEKEVVN